MSQLEYTKNQQTFLIMAGGTGGHIFPGLAVAAQLQQQGHKVVWLGADGGMETRLVPKYDIQLETLAIKGIRGHGLKRKLLLPIILSRAVLGAVGVIKRHHVDMVIGFGGFASFPGGIAAKLLGKPVLIHEQNAVAGLSNKILAKLASRVLYAFPDVLPYPNGLVGNPVRADIAHLAAPATRFSTREGALKLLVVGGSLGAQIFNEVLPQAMALLPLEQRPVIMHQCGRGEAQQVQQRYQNVGVEAQCVDFIDDMLRVYTDADLVLCRAGALSIAELAAAGIGSILVPFPHAVDDHQTKNAQYLVVGEAAYCLPQPQLTPQILAEKIGGLTRQGCLTLALNARALALPDAAIQVANIAVETLGIKVKQA